MTAKEYLNQTIAIKRDIDRKKQQIAELESMAERATSTANALRSGGTSKHSKLEDAIIKIMPLKDRLADDIARFTEKYKEISVVIDAVDNPIYRELLALRYLSCKRWEEIAAIMHYSWRHTLRVHGDALQKIRLVLKMS